MTKNPLMLYDAKIALEFEGQWLLLNAITEIQGDTSVVLQGASRKTLFGYAPDLLHARQHGSISVTVTQYITKGFPEEVFFRMAGFRQQSNRNLILTYPEKLGTVQSPATMFVESAQGSFCLTNCVVEGIDVPFAKDKVGQFTVTLQAARVDIVDTVVIPTTIRTQGQHMLPQPVYSQLSGYQQSQVGQTATFQRTITTLDQANCFNTDEIVSQGHRLLSDSNLGISIQEYVTKERLLLPYSFETGAEVSQQGLSIRQVSGIATKRVSLQSVHSMYWDFKATDTIEIIGPKED